MAGRAGVGGQLATEKLEILWGSRGNPREWALRRSELVDVQKIIAEVRKSIESLKTALQEVKDDIDDINAQITQIETRLNEVEQNINDLETAMDALEQRILDAEGALTQLEADIATISTELGNVGGDVTQLELDVNELELGLPSLTVTSDLNAAVRNKEFQWSNTSTNTPVAGSYGRGWTVASSANDLTQFGVINTTGRTYVRFRTGGVWGVWQDLASLQAAPYADQVNPAATSFPAGAYTAIPFFTSNELSGGITKTSNTIFTVPQAGIYMFELGIKVVGGGSGQPPGGTLLGISTDTTTVPTSLRTGYSAAGVVSMGANSTTLIRLVCMERLAAGAQRVVYFYNSGSGEYQLANAGVKITRLSA